MLALLAIEGEQSGYDLLKLVSKAIANVWSPARSQLYALLPRLARDGLAESRHVAQERVPDKTVYRISAEGRRALDEWLETLEPGAREATWLRLFVGGLTTDDVLIRHLEQYRADAEAFLDELRAIEPTNTREGHDRYHGYLLDLGIANTLAQVRWADAVLDDLRS